MEQFIANQLRDTVTYSWSTIKLALYYNLILGQHLRSFKLQHITCIHNHISQIYNQTSDVNKILLM